MTPRLVPFEKAKNVIKFENGTAFIRYVPFSDNFTDEEKRQIDAATKIRAFLHCCVDTPVPPGISRPVTLADFPLESILWLWDRCTLIHPVITDCRDIASTPADLAKVLLDMDAKAKTRDHRGVFTLVSNQPFDVGEFISMHRSHAPHGLAVPPSLKAALKNIEEDNE
jgi:hypothetical protein